MPEKLIKKINSEIISNCVEDTEKFANELASKLKPSDIVCLIGDLGTGKTIIAKTIAKYFKVDSEVISPTFNIIKIYDTNNNKIKKIYHYDLYRLKSIKELYDIGFDEIISYKDAIHIIEWPEVALDILPDNYYKVSIAYDKLDNNKRHILYEKK